MEKQGQEELSMDSEMWQNLPAEIQIKLAQDHLPLDSLCRFRCVSRSWSKPKIRPEALRGLYIRRSISKRSCRFTISDGSRRRLIKRSSLRFMTDLRSLACINGLFTVVRGVHEQVRFSVSNLFHNSTWTHLPRPPRAPDRVSVFAGMSKVESSARLGFGDFPRLGIDPKLDDYMFVAGMGNYIKDLNRITNLVLQVYRGGKWSSSLFQFPDGHCLMYSPWLKNGCGVLRGSVFYFLLMRLDKTSAKLCCMDLLTSDKQCKVLCELEKHVVHQWKVASTVHPKLAICSGKILLVYQVPLPEKDEWTLGVQMFDEEKVAWRSLSVLPRKIRGKINQYDIQVYQPHRVLSGGDELVVSDIVQMRDLRYSFATDTWSAMKRSSVVHDNELIPISCI